MFGLTLAASLLSTAGYLIAGGEPDSEGLVRSGRLILLVDRPDNGLTIGFDRTPVPSLLMAIWLAVPGIKFGLLAGALGASVALAATAVWLRQILSGIGGGGRAWLLPTLAVIANPIVASATVSGSPEVAVLGAQIGLLLAIAVWLRHETPGWLMVVGFAAGTAIVTDIRFVVLLLAALVTALVRGWMSGRARRSDADAIAILLPVGFIAGFWSIVCWIATGSATRWIEETISRFTLSGGLAAGADLIAFTILVVSAARPGRLAAPGFLVALGLGSALLLGGPPSLPVVMSTLPVLVIAGAGLRGVLPARLRSIFSAGLSIVIVIGVPIAVEHNVNLFRLQDRPTGEATAVADLRAAARLLDTATGPRRSLVDGDLGDIVVAFAERPDRYLTSRDPEFALVNTTIAGSVELLLVGNDDGPIVRRHPDIRRRNVEWARIELDRPGLRVLRLNEPVRSMR